jgi:hypothetical protein
LRFIVWSFFKARLQFTLDQFNGAMSHPLAFLAVIIYAGLWMAFDRSSLDWHGVAAIAIWLMTLLIQRAEHRDSAGNPCQA